MRRTSSSPARPGRPRPALATAGFAGDSPGTRRRRAAGLLPTAFLGVLVAATTCAAGEAGEALGLDELGIQATIELRNFSHFKAEAGDDAVRNEARLDLEWERKLTDNLKASAHLRGWADDDGLVDGFVIEVPDNRRHRTAIDIAEAELAARIGKLRLYAGRRIYSWGTADAYNPTDRLNSRDLMDPVAGYQDTEKLGAWSAAATMDLGGVLLDLVWVPFFSPTRLPPISSRWVGLDRETFSEEFPNRADKYDEFVRVLHAPAPSSTFENSQVGLRAKTSLGGWDLVATYYDGFLDLPEVDIPTFEFFFPRIHVPGFAVSTTLGAFELHGETAFVFGEEGSSGDRAETIVGFNYYLDPRPWLHLEQGILVLEYGRQDTLSDGEGATLGLGTLTEIFRRNDAIASRLELLFGESTTVELDFAMASVTDPGYFFGPRVTRKIRDDLELETGFDLFFGGRQQPFGFWRDNNRLHLTLRWSL
jgi:hypothetical protein